MTQPLIPTTPEQQYNRLLQSPFNSTLTSLRQEGRLNQHILTRVLVGQIADQHNKGAEILVMAYLSAYPEAFRQFAPRILKTPPDWVLFINLCRKGGIRKGMGRCIKREICHALASYGTFEKTWFLPEIRQMLKVSHPKGLKLFN